MHAKLCLPPSLLSVLPQRRSHSTFLSLIILSVLFPLSLLTVASYLLRLHTRVDMLVTWRAIEKIHSAIDEPPLTCDRRDVHRPS